MNTAILLGLVIPCYNEAEVIETTVKQLANYLDDLESNDLIKKESIILLVDDGSQDNTWQQIIQLKAAYPRIRGLKLSRNFGHQNALLAGLLHIASKTDCVISLDADLQDDIQIIPDMLAAYRNGAHLVYGVRKSRARDGWFKRTSALFFYRTMRLLGVDLISNHADYRLASARILQELQNFHEVNLFLRGIFPLLGFKHAIVYYDRLERRAGYTKYPLTKMLAFALDGITSFSVKPLRFVTLLGFCISMVSLVLGSYVIYSYFMLNVVRGWSSIVLPLYFLGGIQLFCIGIIGEYLGRIYQETKQRPRFIIEMELE